MQDIPMMDDWRYRRGFEDSKRSVRAEMDIAISSLQQQLAAAREELDGCKAALHIACGERSLAREALQAAEADAARYRCLRDSDFGTLYYRDDNCELRTHYPPSKSACEDLDAAIDATLQRDRQP